MNYGHVTSANQSELQYCMIEMKVVIIYSYYTYFFAIKATCETTMLGRNCRNIPYGTFMYALYKLMFTSSLRGDSGRISSTDRLGSMLFPLKVSGGPRPEYAADTCSKTTTSNRIVNFILKNLKLLLLYTKLRICITLIIIIIMIIIIM